MKDSVFETKRLFIRPASAKDAGLFFEIWNSTEIMKNVGFPNGLGISLEKIQEKIQNNSGDQFQSLLAACKKSNNQPIGECKLHRPDEDHIARTDIKLLPKFHGQGFGTEIKIGLVDYLFENTDCEMVEASPNIENQASIKMQEKVGGKKIREEVYHFPENMQSFTEDVHCIIYRIYRKDWESSSRE